MKRFIKNGLLMAAASILLRLLGVWFNAFVTARIGADGMGLFSLVMSVYGLSVTAASAGVNLAANRLCAKEIERTGSAREVLRRCFLYAGTCGGVSACALYIGAERVALDWLGDGRCTASLKLLALSLPFIALSNVLHGYFSAVRKVSKSAGVAVFEQLFKTGFTVWALLCLVPDGIEYACMAIVGGGALAESASFLAALCVFLLEKRRWKPARFMLSAAEGKALTRELFGITVPVAAAAVIRSGLTTLEHTLIPRGLRANPATADTALAAYGVLCGMAMPVVMFPTALLYSFTGLLITEFAEAETKGARGHIRSMTGRALGATLMFSVGCALCMGIYADRLGEFIYHIPDAGLMIRAMAPLVPVMYLDHCVDAMLKGLGEQVYVMKVNIFDAGMCAFLVWLLCPRIGIWGYVVTIYVSELINAALSVGRLLVRTEYRLSWAAIARTALGAAAAYLLTGRFGTAEGTAALFGGIAVTAGVYLAVLLLTGAGKLLSTRQPARRKTQAAGKAVPAGRKSGRDCFS